MIYGLIGFIIGAGLLFVLSYILPKGRIKRHNDELDKEEQAQSARIEAIRKSADLEAIRAENLKIKYDADFAVLDEKKNSIKNEIDITKQSAEKMAQSYYNEKIAEAEKLIQKAIDTMEVSLEREASAKQKAHFALIDLLDKEYQELREDATAELSEAIRSARAELDALTSTLGFLKSCVDSATEENKRAKLEAEAKNFYRIVVSKEDAEEIAKIRSIEPYLRNAEVLNKVIWTYYYKTPANDMLNRVIGKEQKTGIYKITNVNDGMVYVGQAVSIKDRWLTHIKRGIAAENGGRVKLYPAMYEQGVENFTFEILEECLPEELNDKEKYWIDFYNGVEYGYNMKL